MKATKAQIEAYAAAIQKRLESVDKTQFHEDQEVRIIAKEMSLYGQCATLIRRAGEADGKPTDYYWMASFGQNEIGIFAIDEIVPVQFTDAERKFGAPDPNPMNKSREAVKGRKKLDSPAG